MLKKTEKKKNNYLYNCEYLFLIKILSKILFQFFCWGKILQFEGKFLIIIEDA